MCRDVYRCVSSQLADTFHRLETDGMLIPLNKVACTSHTSLRLTKFERVSRELEQSSAIHRRQPNTISIVY